MARELLTTAMLGRVILRTGDRLVPLLVGLMLAANAGKRIARAGGVELDERRPLAIAWLACGVVYGAVRFLKKTGRSKRRPRRARVGATAVGPIAAALGVAMLGTLGLSLADSRAGGPASPGGRVDVGARAAAPGEASAGVRSADAATVEVGSARREEEGRAAARALASLLVLGGEGQRWRMH